MAPPQAREVVSETCRLLDEEGTSSRALQDTASAICTYQVRLGVSSLSRVILTRNVLRQMLHPHCMQFTVYMQCYINIYKRDRSQSQKWGTPWTGLQSMISVLLKIILSFSVFSDCRPPQVTFCPGSLKERAGIIPQASPLRCRWPSRPVTERQTTATSLENLSCQVGKPARHILKN